MGVVGRENDRLRRRKEGGREGGREGWIMQGQGKRRWD